MTLRSLIFPAEFYRYKSNVVAEINVADFQFILSFYITDG